MAGGIVETGGKVVEIGWVANPYRGDEFEAAWLPAAEAVLRYGATGWAFFRTVDGNLNFTQLAFFEDKDDFERYWLSEEVAEHRVKAAGMHQVPVNYKWYTVEGAGSFVAPPEPAR